MHIRPSIVLTTLNAAYIHASLGLRYLLANMGNLRPQTALREFTIARHPQQVADELLLALAEPYAPEIRKNACTQIIGFGVYIWNVSQTIEVIRRIRDVRPEIKIVLGGPEVSHETNEQEITSLADYVITGWGDLSFTKLCSEVLLGICPPNKIIEGEQPDINRIVMPYAEYSTEDLAHRILYVEASRGCPFSCEFCLSALDKTARAFDVDTFLGEMDTLYKRGARNFKFVDRTFNLKAETSLRILDFFLDKLKLQDDVQQHNLFLHFEVIPDRLPPSLKARIAQFPAGILQLEIGIQSFAPEVQRHISRRQDNEKTIANLQWLAHHSNVHLHTDLIFGLPGETLESFGAGFDCLHEAGPHEIQVGVLKRLRGTPIVRRTEEHGMIYDTSPPYQIRETKTINADTMERVSRFARYWDMIANSGRFPKSLDLLLNSDQPEREKTKPEKTASPFHAFMDFSDWLWLNTGKTHGLSPESLVDALFEYLGNQRTLDPQQVRAVLLSDYVTSGTRGSPKSLAGLLPKRDPQKRQPRSLMQRQAYHHAKP